MGKVGANRIKDLSGDTSGFLQGSICWKNAVESKRQQLKCGWQKNQTMARVAKGVSGAEGWRQAGRKCIEYVLCLKNSVFNLVSFP